MSLSTGTVRSRASVWEAKMPASAARVAAFKVLLRVATEDAYAAELLHSKLLDGLSQADRGLAMQITMGVLRWQSSLDAEIGRFAARRLDVEVAIALRMAVFQMRYLERVPDHAAVHESVELVKMARKRSAVQFVNAILRQISRAVGSSDARNAASEIFRPKALDAATLASRFAHPEWLVRGWEAQFGHDAVQRICDFDQQAPQTHIRTKADHDQEDVETELAKDGITFLPGALLSRARVVAGGDGAHTAAFREGRVAIQDEASQLVALLTSAAAPDAGNIARILDCCAAPGGKTRLLAELHPQATLFAVELHPHRARLLQQLCRAENVKVITGDIRKIPFASKEQNLHQNELDKHEELPAEFPLALVDVPCSGTGTLARNPEIKWRLTPQKVTEMAALQFEILASALSRVAPGGRLVYSTCSLESAECTQLVDRALIMRDDLKLLSCDALLQRLRDSGDLVWTGPQLCAGEFLRTLPGTHPCDGFFAAVIERRV